MDAVLSRFTWSTYPSTVDDLLVNGRLLLLPLVLLVAASSAALILVAHFAAKRVAGSAATSLAQGDNAQASSAGAYALIVAFGVLGGVAGLVSGNSREPIAGPLLSGMLGIITALLSYLFSKEGLSTYRPYIPFLVIALVLDSLLGLSVGSVYRKRSEIAAYDRSRYMLLYEKVYLELLKEEELLKLREKYPKQLKR